jgi:hypothetical protein
MLQDAASFVRFVDAPNSRRWILPTYEAVFETKVGYLKFMSLEVTRAEWLSSGNLCRLCGVSRGAGCREAYLSETEDPVFHLAVGKTATLSVLRWLGCSLEWD